MKMEDGCIMNSNILSSLKPQTHHGHQLGSVFCYDWNRPNCVGGRTAAQVLLDYSRQFMKKYSRWAQLIHFVDTHEDTMAIAGMLDSPFSKFMTEVAQMENTAIILLADHGLHYGPYFLVPSGEAERAMPILYTRFPDRFKVTSSHDQFLTPFDIHRTLLELA